MKISTKKSKITKAGASRSPASQPRKQSKQERVVAMLRHKEGTSIAAIMKATGWQKHSVRGFLAGVARKKLGLPLVSETTNGIRVYSIADGKLPKVNSAKCKQAA